MEINILKQAVAENQILVNNTIDTVFVTRFLNGMLRIPTEIRLRFKTFNEKPAITVTLTYRDKKGRLIKEELTTIANGELINAVISAMGSNLKPIHAFHSKRMAITLWKKPQIILSWKCLKNSWNLHIA